MIVLSPKMCTYIVNLRYCAVERDASDSGDVATITVLAAAWIQMFTRFRQIMFPGLDIGHNTIIK